MQVIERSRKSRIILIYALPVLLAAALTITLLLAPSTSGRGPSLRVKPSVAAIGGTIKVSGIHFYANKTVSLYIGVPNSDVGGRVASKRTNARGSFKKNIRLSNSIDPGKWVVLACQRGCRTKATKRFTVTVTGY